MVHAVKAGLGGSYDPTTPQLFLRSCSILAYLLGFGSDALGREVFGHRQRQCSKLASLAKLLHQLQQLAVKVADAMQ